MRTSTRIGIVGSGFAVAGSAALAALAPNAAASGTYHSTAQAVSGQVNIGGTPASPVSASATPSNSPQASSVPSSSLAAELKQGLSGFPVPVTTVNSGPDLVAVEATATSDGHSTGCAAVLASSCEGGGTPLSFTLSPTSLAGVGAGALPDVTIVVNGPKASCSAGPNGSGLSASDGEGQMTAEVQGQSPVHLSAGQDLFSQLSGPLSTLAKQTSITPIIGQGSRQVGSGKASATAGEIGLDGPSGPIFKVTGATATCGPNNAAGGTGGTGPGTGGKGGKGGTGGSGGSGATTTGSTIPTSSSTSGETPLSGVQTDEGRSPSSATKDWLALSGTP